MIALPSLKIILYHLGFWLAQSALAQGGCVGQFLVAQDTCWAGRLMVQPTLWLSKSLIHFQSSHGLGTRESGETQFRLTQVGLLKPLGDFLPFFFFKSLT